MTPLNTEPGAAALNYLKHYRGQQNSSPGTFCTSCLEWVARSFQPAVVGINVAFGLGVELGIGAVACVEQVYLRPTRVGVPSN